MGFIVYDIIFLVVFCLVVGLFLYKHRSKAKWEGILLLYRTQVGITFIDYVDKHFGRAIAKLKWVIILTGYVSMGVMTYLLLQLLWVFFKAPEVVRAVKIPPLAPLIPYLPELFKVDFLPPFYFTYWILAIAVIALSHEFAHGIFAKINRVHVKSTGFGFLGPFLAAFVEPDEEQMQKIKKSDQLAILGAGSFANILMTVLFFFLLWLFFAASFVQAGAGFNTYTFDIVNISDIALVGNMSTVDGIGKALEQARIVKQVAGHNFTDAVTGGKKYYLDVSLTREHLERNLTSTILYESSPALEAALEGVIVELDGRQIQNREGLSEVLAEKSPGDQVLLKTQVDGEMREYSVTLAEHPEIPGRAFIGVGNLNGGSGGVLGGIKQFALFFRDPGTHYAPRFHEGFVIFIYDLLWWIIIINISVALVNMLPLGIFDGGRVFYVTLWGLFKSEKAAKRGYRVATQFLLLVFVLLMVAWAVAVF